MKRIRLRDDRLVASKEKAMSHHSIAAGSVDAECLRFGKYLQFMISRSDFDFCQQTPILTLS